MAYCCSIENPFNKLTLNKEKIELKWLMNNGKYSGWLVRSANSCLSKYDLGRGSYSNIKDIYKLILFRKFPKNTEIFLIKLRNFNNKFNLNMI
jgi:hypothetical protein